MPTIKTLFLITIFSVSLKAQSINANQISCPGSTTAMQLVLGNTTNAVKSVFICVQLRNTDFSLNTGTVPPTLQIIGGSGAATWGSITGVITNQADLVAALALKQNVLTLPLSIANGGNGTNSPTLTAGANVIVTGNWPNYTISSNGGSGAIWGAISGNLSSQTDLVAALAAKQNTLTLPLSISNGGTGTATPSLTAGTNISLTGNWPNYTINATSGSVNWGSIGGTLSTQTDLNTALNGKQATGNYITGLTGVVFASGPGIATATLQTTGVTPGSYTNLNAVIGADGRITGASSGGGGGSSYNQTVQVNGTNQTQAATFNLACTGTANCTGSTSGGVTTISVVGSSGGTAIESAGLLSAIPTTCTPGSGIYHYFATDQPVGQQDYDCTGTNVWTQKFTTGPSGALVVTDGTLDIVTSVLPRSAAANLFTGVNTFTQPQVLANGFTLYSSSYTSAQPSCDSTHRGTMWYQNNGSSKDSLQVCVWTGTAYSWFAIY